MDLTTLFLVYAAVLFVCAGALVITWRQNPGEVGARSWAVGSLLGAFALVLLAVSGSPSLAWLNFVGRLMAVAGVAHYALGTRQFVTGVRAIPRWFVVLFVGGFMSVALAILLTPVGKGAFVGVGSLLVAVYLGDVVLTLLRHREARTAPGLFLAFFFVLLGGMAVVQGVLTLLEPGLDYYARPIDGALMFVGAVGAAASAMGFSMLTTSRLLTDRKRHFDELEASVDDLRRQLEGLARGDYGVRARQHGSSDAMDGLATLFNRTAEQVGAAFGEIERQRSVLEATFESMVDGLILVDDAGTLLRVNPSFAEMTGLTTEALVGRDLAEIVDPAEHSRAAEILASVSDAPVRTRPLLFRTASGQAIRLTVNASSHRDEAGTLLGVVLIVRDDRDLEEARAQLQISDRMAAMGTVAAGVAHEINNPLAFVVSNLDFALEELRDSDLSLDEESLAEIVAALEAAHRGGDRVRRLVKDLKTLTRPADETRSAVDVNALVESAVAMLDNEIRHHARLELDLGEVVPVEAGEAKLAQVFLNLVHNAVQAIPAGNVEDHRVAVKSGLDGEGCVLVEVRDTGEGIDPEHLARIFDAFFTTKPVGVGTGLGLSICHRVVTGLGGRIEVESQPGRGTTFRVLLPPAARPADVQSDEPPPTGDRAVAGTGRRVLVVDDEVEVGESIRRILGRDHTVEIATHPKEALTRILDGDFDVILCDLMMPDMTGMQLHAEVLERAPALAGRMVFLSGGVFSPGAAEFLRESDNPVLHKPFRAEMLRRIVAETGDARPAA